MSPFSTHGALVAFGFTVVLPKPLRRYAAVAGPCLTPFGVWHFPRGARGRHTWLTRGLVGSTSSPDADAAGDIFPHPFVAGLGGVPLRGTVCMVFSRWLE